jgi:hypothetical protein
MGSVDDFGFGRLVFGQPEQRNRRISRTDLFAPAPVQQAHTFWFCGGLSHAGSVLEV